MDLNSFLKQTQPYLTDLNITDKSKILSSLSDQLQSEDLSKLDPRSIVNKKRVEMGLDPFIEKKKSSLASLFIKSFVVMSIVFILFISFLIAKFTPLLKIDEENGKVIMLGGLIDIDAKAGKFIIGDDINFTDSQYLNYFSSEIDLPQNIEDIIISIDSGNYVFDVTETQMLSLDCKFSTPPTSEIITQEAQSISINFKKRQGSCKIKIPKDKTLRIDADTAQISINKPDFHVFLKLKNGNAILTPNEKIDYDYKFEVENGQIDTFQTSGTNNGYQMNFNLKNGSIKKAL